jgi:hypothetical protein
MNREQLGRGNWQSKCLSPFLRKKIGEPRDALRVRARRRVAVTDQRVYMSAQKFFDIAWKVGV